MSFLDLLLVLAYRLNLDLNLGVTFRTCKERDLILLDPVYSFQETLPVVSELCTQSLQFG